MDIPLLSHAAFFISGLHQPLCTVLFLSISDYEIQAGSCMSVKLLALRSGFSTLTVTYQYKEIILKASVTVGAYHPLKVSHKVLKTCWMTSTSFERYCCFYILSISKSTMTASGQPVWNCSVCHGMHNNIHVIFLVSLFLKTWEVCPWVTEKSLSMNWSKKCTGINSTIRVWAKAENLTTKSTFLCNFRFLTLWT